MKECRSASIIDGIHRHTDILENTAVPGMEFTKTYLHAILIKVEIEMENSYDYGKL